MSWTYRYYVRCGRCGWRSEEGETESDARLSYDGTTCPDCNAPPAELSTESCSVKADSI